ncbi:MAG: PH domain-containing protein [Planctomycetota bacterium]
MTATVQPETEAGTRAAQAESPSTSAVKLPVSELVPAHLLDGGEVVHFAIKPSPWFVVLVSLRWLLVAIVLGLAALQDFFPQQYRGNMYQLAAGVAGVRLAWAILEWVSRLYVLTNKRVMRIRGVFNVELFECALDRLQNTYGTFSLPERLTRVGTISVQTAAAGGGPGGTASWRIVSRPLEVHEQLRDAIRRARNRGSNGV